MKSTLKRIISIALLLFLLDQSAYAMKSDDVNMSDTKDVQLSDTRKGKKRSNKDAALENENKAVPKHLRMEQKDQKVERKVEVSATTAPVTTSDLSTAIMLYVPPRAPVLHNASDPFSAQSNSLNAIAAAVPPAPRIQATVHQAFEDKEFRTFFVEAIRRIQSNSAQATTIAAPSPIVVPKPVENKEQVVDQKQDVKQNVEIKQVRNRSYPGLRTLICINIIVCFLGLVGDSAFTYGGRCVFEKLRAVLFLITSCYCIWAGCQTGIDALETGEVPPIFRSLGNATLALALPIAGFIFSIISRFIF